MASCGRTTNRALMVVLLAASLAFAVVGVFMPFFKLPDGFVAATERANVTSALPSGVQSGSMTMWDVTFTLPSASSLSASSSDLSNGTHEEELELRSAYYTCKTGRTNIQIGEGFAVVTCVLCCANLIMSVFTFFFSPVVRVPLAVYAFLSAVCAGVTIGMLVHGYLHTWCPEDGNTLATMKEDGWRVGGAGLPLFAVSAALSLVVTFMAAIGG